jgi:acyl-CoA synthetase (AMP-forming)/AMP-acid ligase II
MPNPSAPTSSTAAPSTEENIYQHTLLNPRIRGDKVALWCRPKGSRRDLSRTFDELKGDANRIAAWLRAQGLGPGSRVLILVPMSFELYALIMGVAQIGAVCVFLDMWATRAQIDAAIAAAAPDVFFGIPKAHLLRLTSPAFRRIPIQIRVGSGWLGRPYRRILETTRPDPTVAPVSPDDAAIIAYTTGSTGRPKAVRRSHGYVRHMLDALDVHEAKRIDAIDFPCWPILLFDGLCHGRTSVIPQFPPGKIAEADPVVLLDQMISCGVTLLTGPPSLFERLADHCERMGRTLPVEHAFAGGAVVPPTLLHRIQRLMPRGSAYVVYGSTEVEPISIASARELAEAPEGPGTCVGRLHPALELKIVRGHEGPIVLGERLWDEWELPVGEWGEIVVSGPHVAVDYYEDPDAFALNKIREPSGRIWHRTGDTGYLDETGRIFLTGRLSHIVTTERGRLYPVPIEREAKRIAGVGNAALMAMGQEAWMIIEPAPGADARSVIDLVKVSLGHHPIDRFQLHSRLPVDPRHNSKIDLDRLRAELAGRTP